MFSTFSWSGFLLYSLLVTAIFYPFIGWQFYRREIYHLLFRRRQLLQHAKDKPLKERPDHLQKVHELVSALGVIIRNASEDKSFKPELLFSLEQKIKDFHLLSETEYKGKINLYIAEELEVYGIDGVSEEEIDALWKTI